MSGIVLPGVIIAWAVTSTWWLTGHVRKYAMERAMLDVPNHRSSHANPTPRGGGIAIVVVVLATLVALRLLDAIPSRVLFAVAGGGLAVAVVGWLDDRGHVAVPARFAVHTIAAAWVVAWLGGMPSLRLGIATVPVGWVGSAIAVFGIVWLTNLYNFMDGIDGIAAGEAVSVGSIGALLMLPSTSALALVAMTVAAASAGFLILNWSPARIFMGDSGSGFLGFAFGTLSVASERAGSLPLAIWVLLLSVFSVDATVTLVRRALRSEAWYRPHRNHAYQRLVQAGFSHRTVTGGVLALNLALGLLSAIGTARPSMLLPMLGSGLVLVMIVYLIVETVRPMALDGSVSKPRAVKKDGEK